MAKIKRKYYVVEGFGMFPYDMLRYDHSWPHSELHDSNKLTMNYDGELRRVMLASDSENVPNRDRWKSFNWKVIASGGESAHIEQWREMQKISMFSNI